MNAATGPVFTIQRSKDRAYFDHGWLKTYHSFSFADYYDPANQNWGALRVFNDDTVAGGAGFPPHPHRDMEILTYVLDGRLQHRDSMGNEGIVSPGGVQFMSAGTGVRHSEFNADPSASLHFVQMWVLPGTIGQPPSYGQMEFAQAERTNRWLVMASGRAGADAPIRLTQDAAFAVTRLEGAELRYGFDPKRYAFVFVASGEAAANGETLNAGDAVRLYDIDHLTVNGTAELCLWDIPALD